MKQFPDAKCKNCLGHDYMWKNVMWKFVSMRCPCMGKHCASTGGVEGYEIRWKLDSIKFQTWWMTACRVHAILYLLCHVLTFQISIQFQFTLHVVRVNPNVIMVTVSLRTGHVIYTGTVQMVKMRLIVVRSFCSYIGIVIIVDYISVYMICTIYYLVDYNVNFIYWNNENKVTDLCGKI